MYIASLNIILFSWTLNMYHGMEKIFTREKYREFVFNELALAVLVYC